MHALPLYYVTWTDLLGIKFQHVEIVPDVAIFGIFVPYTFQSKKIFGCILEAGRP